MALYAAETPILAQVHWRTKIRSFWNVVMDKERKLDLYSAPLWAARLWSAQVWIIQLLHCKLTIPAFTS